jgi:hypothetical protein
MTFLKYIHVPVFLVSLAVGLFFVYLTIPDMRNIYVYPTPENVDILQYKDKASQCFQYKEKEVPCPENDKELSVIPPQV